MQRKGGYQTKQKAQILSYLRENRGRHLTAAELLHMLTENGTPIGAATVYRQLEKLENEGLVRRYALDDRGSASGRAPQSAKLPMRAKRLRAWALVREAPIL